MPDEINEGWYKLLGGALDELKAQDSRLRDHHTRLVILEEHDKNRSQWNGAIGGVIGSVVGGIIVGVVLAFVLGGNQ